ncbi:MAG: tRNA (uridine(34)/cytosine(34)/5-carboxymethylaminomethyluridine(34)-2'-O)-methyltransferase TrmL [Ruminococcaceae bacterium]|nr:tRNA (uridine(34)/cytosine(34)/5-carboxymethylaminomethyluridine(34)-2'-O)-methyltransferase TrmL [Oscillospiraceae bacterium]
MSRIHIVLFEPEIPQNTGNVARTCAATGASLHLIRPLGFAIDDKKLKRAGLDYWDKLDITYYDGLNDFFKKHPDAEIFYFTTKARHGYTEITYPAEVFLMFGKESAGLPEELLFQHPDRAVRIPMRDRLRSLNLSNSVAIAVYEVLRQNDFGGLAEQGSLTKYDWSDAGER